MRFRVDSIAGVVMTGSLALIVLTIPTAASASITLRTCNNTRHTVLVASSYIPVGGSEWRNVGWTRVNAHACASIFRTNNRTFYARAEIRGDSRRYWGSDIKQCVEYPGPYDFYTGSEDTTCPEGVPREFTTLRSDGRSVYIWNLDP